MAEGIESQRLHAESKNVGMLLTVAPETNVLSVSDALATVLDGVTTRSADELTMTVRSFTMKAAEQLLDEIVQRKREAADHVRALTTADAVVRLLAERLSTAGPYEDDDAVNRVDELRASFQNTDAAR